MGHISDIDFGYAAARHLLWRAGFGGTPKQIQTLASWGPEKSVAYLLTYDQVTAPQPPTPTTFDPNLMRPPTREERPATSRPAIAPSRTATTSTSRTSASGHEQPATSQT